MRLLDDDNSNEGRGSGSNMTYIYMALIMSTVILGVTALVFWVNRSGSRSDGSGYAAAVAQREAREAGNTSAPNDSERVVSSNKLTSDELDIWTLPDTGRQSGTNSSRNNGTVTNQTTGETVIDGSKDSKTDKSDASSEDEVGKTTTYDMAERENLKDTDSDPDSEADQAKDEEEKERETRIRVTHSDGTREWVDINEDLPASKYDFDKLKYQKPIMKYYKDGKLASWCGISIDASLGEIDFDKLKKAGCDFCMVKVGARGYSSGRIVMDENYKTNLRDAYEAGLDVGVYFCSQAVTKSEAREEADVLLDAIGRYDIDYPIVFVMQDVVDDMPRIDALSVKEKSDIARTFMNEIADAGYTPMLYGDLEWLMTMVDMDRLEGYDVWYSQDADEPDYPYEFGMWEYEFDGSVKGVTGDVRMSISFVNYSGRED
ncbi:MAG: hypothetical protein NC337_13135 [Roseburia sp.]|nr:hypothetical protein [Roseburia sp.]